MDNLQIKACYLGFSLRKFISIQTNKDAMWAKFAIGGVFYREINNRFELGVNFHGFTHGIREEELLIRP